MRNVSRSGFAVVALAAVGLLATAGHTSALAQPAPMISFGAPYNWTGPYFGINGGYGWGNSNYSFMPGGSGDGEGLFAPEDTGSSFGEQVSGGMLGGQFGSNYQWSNLVFGLEATMDWSKASGKAIGSPEDPAATYESRMRWMATLTPRIGYAWGNLLFYGKGGLAAAQMSSSLASPGQSESFGDTHAYLGWTAGAGVEMALLGPLTVGLEYNYYSFGTQRFGGEVTPDTTFPIDYTVRQNFSTVLARVSYKFGVPGTGAGATPPPPMLAFTGPWNAPTDWSGPYIGFNGGFGWGSNGYAFEPGGSGDGDGLFAPNNVADDLSGPASFHQSMQGGVAGGQIGFNQQWANLVLGLEATADWSGLSATSTNVLPTNSSPVSYQTKLRWLATITPRLGYAWGNLLFYVKGGLAAAELSSSLNAPNFDEGPTSFSTSHDYLGWTFGIGAEMALYQHLVVGIEYDAYGLNGQRYGGEVSPNTTWPLDYSIHPTFNTVMARISYKFGGPLAPPPAVAPMAAPAPAVAPARSYLVFFDWDKATLTERARQIIKEAADNSTRVSYTRLEVNGYTDTSGTPQYNQGLSVRRAQAVAAELVKDGVPKAAIAIQGFGETHLLVPTGPGVREPQNRRVEIIIH
jgi:opacity protein-like surface antigen